jgi:hypothetical protein
MQHGTPVSVPAEIRTNHLPILSLQRCRSSVPQLGVKVNNNNSICSLLERETVQSGKFDDVSEERILLLSPETKSEFSKRPESSKETFVDEYV